MLNILSISADWIASGAAVIGLIALVPVISKWIRSMKTPKETKEVLSDAKRKIETQPVFELYDTLNTFQNKIVKLKNIGAKAFHISLVAIGTQASPKLVLDKYEAESEEAVTVFLGDHFRILPTETLELLIGFSDVEGRRYQQTYSKTLQKVHLAAPILLVTRK